jgi:hypothetical protein
MYMNLPFGDELMCSAPDLNEQHFTGQNHDQETGNDYFNARYTPTAPAGSCLPTQGGCSP